MKISRFVVLLAIVGTVAANAKPFGSGINQPVQSYTQPKPQVYTYKPIQQRVVAPKTKIDYTNPIIQPLQAAKPVHKKSVIQATPVTTPITKPLQNAATLNGSAYDPKSLNNPYGAGSPYKADGIKNTHSKYGSPYSNQSATNPYATEAPKLYNSDGKYLGKLSANKYDPESISNPHGTYGSPYSAKSIKNQFGAGNPYSATPIYVVPKP